MADLTTTQAAKLFDGQDAPIDFGHYAVTFSDPAVASLYNDNQGTAGVQGVSAGTCTVTVTRLSDNVTATLDVTVEGAAPFTVHLGTPFTR